MTEADVTATPSDYTQEQTARASERFTDVMPATYDEKDDMGLLREKLSQRKKPIYAGLAFLCVVVIGVSIAVTSGSSTEASTSSGYTAPTETTPAPTPVAIDTEDSAATVHADDESSASGNSAGSTDATGSSSSSASVAGEALNEEGFLTSNASSSRSSMEDTTAAPTSVTNPPSVGTPDSTTPTPTTSTPEPTTPAPTTSGPALPYYDLNFNWKDSSNWEYADGSAVSSSMVTSDGIKLTPSNSAQPIRTKTGWGGEKIVLIEWERSSTSDTNIWMLNTKLQNQFATGNGWPYWGEIDIFEMFTQDKIDKPAYDFSGFGGFTDVSSYGQLTLHNGPAWPADPCYCNAAPSKSAWYDNTSPMTSSCTAQFANSATNKMATIWGSDSNGQYLQLLQNPTVTKGGVVNNVQTYDVSGGTPTTKIYNNAKLFWGTPSTLACASAGGHNPTTGFPFFEDFRLILEEQKQGDSSAWFKVNNVQIFKKN